MAGHKWWRLINFKSLEPAKGNWDVGAYKIKFITQSGVISTNPDKIKLQSLDSQSWVGKTTDLVSDNQNTSVVVSASSNRQPWWVSYEFDKPEILNQIYYKPWADWGYEWQTAQVECSDNGIDWIYYGVILPFNLKNEASIKNIIVIGGDTLNLTNFKKTKYLNIYTQNEQGSITGSVKETGLPENAEIALSDRKTRQLIAITRSQDYIYSFKGLDINREYYVHGIDDDRYWQAVTQDMLPGNYDELKALGKL